MQANPSKFQAIFAKIKEEITISIANTNIVIEPVVLLLGVSIDNILSFDSHISNICLKAGRQLNVLRRLAHALDIPSKLAIYKSFIVSNFNYCMAPLWCRQYYQTRKATIPGFEICLQ